MPANPIAQPGRSWISWYTLFVLTLVYAINIADRFVISTFIEPIKRDLELSDSAVAFLTGTGLAVFYIGAGIPLGYLADRVNRRNMIAWALALWTGMTAVCGLTHTYVQLLLARIGVGIGEAGGTAPSQSLIADRFPVELRSFASSIYAVGAAMGVAVGSMVGGWLNDEYGWRHALLLFGLIGLPVALLVRVTLREPARGVIDPVHVLERPTLRETLRFIAGQRSAIHILIGATVATFWGWGIMWWLPSFLVRSYQLTTGAAGAILGPINGYGGAGITLVTAWLVWMNGRRDARRDTWLVGVTTLVATVPGIWMFLTDSLDLTRTLLWIFIPLNYLYLGPTFGMLQNLVPAPMRGLIIAVLLFVANFANLFIAPQLIGIASDVVGARIASPAESLRWVLFGTAFTGIWAAWHYFAAAKWLRQDFARAGNVAN
ncbi:MAG TPA: MFS transporter [Steroidobacteraceae bacterium]|nr:MFS transporter [Steroidobacteraceae bacterium]